MARPPGSENKDKPYREALRRAIARADQNENDPHALDRIAERHLAQAASGDMQAIRELADRLDGKATQLLGGDKEAGAVNINVVSGVPRAGD
jgi:hypothetical protein